MSILKLEKQFKSLISGESNSLPAQTARKGLNVLSKLYEKGITHRNQHFEIPGNSYRADVPVISVGNITVGGTGKTPMVKYLALYLESLGCKPAVLSRGYRSGNTDRSIVVSLYGDIQEEPQTSGDEAWLLAKSLPNSSIITGRNRKDSAEIATYNLKSDVLLLDDGFQHRALQRDLDIVLIDATNPFGYEHVLPRGLLREPVEELRRASCYVLTKSSQVSPLQLREIEQRLQCIGANIPIMETVHGPSSLTALTDWVAGKSVPIDDTFKELPLLAVSGIGNPESFVTSLHEAGYEVVSSLSYDDHHDYTDDDLIEMWKEAFAHQAKGLVITEKDAVKLAQLPAALTMPLPVLVLGVDIEFRTGEMKFKEMIKECISSNKHKSVVE